MSKILNTLRKSDIWCFQSSKTFFTNVIQFIHSEMGPDYMNTSFTISINDKIYDYPDYKFVKPNHDDYLCILVDTSKEPDDYHYVLKRDVKSCHVYTSIEPDSYLNTIIVGCAMTAIVDNVEICITIRFRDLYNNVSGEDCKNIIKNLYKDAFYKDV